MSEEGFAFRFGDPALRAKSATEYLGLKSLTSFYNLIKQGLLPQGTIICQRGVIWRRSVLDKFLDDLGAKSAQREVTE
ncbi:MAG: hypothetical protein IKN64_11290 [Desulfovibrio sp.]|nr:hypothetical protein [Desulfovibrio sp.]